MPERQIITALLPNGQKVQLEALLKGGVEKVAAGRIPNLATIGNQIEGIVEVLKAPLERIKPSKATVELGIDIAVESGELTALIVKGSATGSLKLSLEWSNNGG